MSTFHPNVCKQPPRLPVSFVSCGPHHVNLRATKDPTRHQIMHDGLQLQFGRRSDPSVSPFGDSRLRCPSQSSRKVLHSRTTAAELAAATYGPPLHFA
eukprot:6034832-Prymnesium_polylepis.1